MAKSYAVMSLTASFIAGSRLAGLYDRRAVELARTTGDPEISAYVGWVTGLRNVGEAKWSVAEMRIDAAVHTAEQIGDRRLTMMALTIQAWPPYVRGEFERVLEIAERQLSMARESNNRLWEAWGLNGIAEPAAMLGDHDTAVRCCQRALAILSEESDRAEEIRALGLLAFSMWRQGRAEEAYATARRGLDRAVSAEITSFIAGEGLAGICEVMLGTCEDAMTRSGSVPSTLRRDSKRAVRTLGRFSKTFLLAQPRHHIAKARLAMVEGASSVAVAELDRALRSAESFGMSHAKGLALLASARCLAIEPDARRRRAEEAASVLKGGEALKQARELASLTAKTTS
jgi:tetratricopeptide (TPR) repeat protein